jgi:hypothetical protein
MSTNETAPQPAPSPFETPLIKTRIAGQTVCNEPAEKDSFCSGHLKLFSIAPKDLLAKVPKGHVLFRCHRCRQLYEGEPMLHLK